MIEGHGYLALAMMAGMAAASAGEWESLCNGNDLSGWRVECRAPDRKKVFWGVADGLIECDTKGDRKHDYVWLVSEREFGDFEFECLVQTFAGSSGNSGIQVRSRFLDDAPRGGWMHGPQIDIHPPGPWRCGMIYDETRETRRWISPPMPSSAIGIDEAVDNWRWVHADGSSSKAIGLEGMSGSEPWPFPPGWNQIRIVARGPRIAVDVNGLQITRFDGTGILDDEAHRRHRVGMRGHIALQLHAGSDLKIRFRDLRIRALEPPDQESPVTVVRNDEELRSALAHLVPGSVLRIAPGRYRPGIFLHDVHGSVTEPIVIEGLDPRDPPLFEGGNEAWHLSDVSHIVLRWLRCHGQKGNGINIDDGGSYDTPSHHVTLAHLIVEDVGPDGNFDGIKCSGVDHLRIRDCRITGWGGQAIDFVGCHHAEIARCMIVGKDGFSQHTGPQFKGGSSDVSIHDCRLENAGLRPIQAGGSTGLEFFRPSDARFEAARIRIENNLVIGGQCAVAFTGVDQATFRSNTIMRPDKWVLRILQERTEPRFVRCRNVDFADNTIIFERSRVRGVANIGPNTRPASFNFRGNHWFASDAPKRSRPDLPTDEQDGVYGVDPNLDPVTGRPKAKPAARR